MILLIILWMVVGLILRFHNLSLKPLWADECSTLVFSLGHSFRTVPLDQLISIEQLLAPLKWRPDSTVLNAAQGLLTESNHPPLFFVLSHWWIDLWQIWSERIGFLFGQGTEDIPLKAVRSLSALFGTLVIPVTYVAAKWLWRSPVSAHISALLMALSPFGIYLAQEARHYTLTVLWIVGSLCCLVAVLRCWRDRHPIPVWLMLGWISVNGLGIATHYFFGLTLVAEALVLGAGLVQLHRQRPLQINPHLKPQPKSQLKPQPKSQLRQNYGRLGAIVLGTVVSGAIWLPFLLAIQQGDELTRWIQSPSGDGWSWLSPLINTMASLVTMLYLLPIQGVGTGGAIASGLGVTGAIVFTLYLIKGSIPEGWKKSEAPWLKLEPTPKSTSTSKPEPTPETDDVLSLFVLVGVVISAIAIMLVVTYGFGMDISQAFRYHFVYFPAVLLVAGRGLAYVWQHKKPQHKGPQNQDVKELDRQDSSRQETRGFKAGTRSRLWIGILLTLALGGALTVTNNLGYQKIHHPDRIVNSMAKRTNHPIIVAISHQSHGQTGRMMSLAWEMQRQSSALTSRSELFNTAQFFLDHQSCHQPGEQNCNTPSSTLRQTLKAQNSPHDLWLLNYEGQANLTQQHCTYRKTKRVDGYKAQHYTCGPKE